MDATRLLERLCARHGLNLEDGVALLPLVERALVSPKDVRDRILTLIETNLARRAEGQGEATIDQLEHDLDDEVLRAVAKTLHAWEPSQRVREFGADAPEGESDAGPTGGLDLPGGLGF
ncbi:MAG: hypothetical protein R3F49_11715 [Planctomycetota bacterium]